MNTNYQLRYAAHPADVKKYDTSRLRQDFLIEKVFTADEVNMVYSMYDRLVVGGAMPAKFYFNSATAHRNYTFIWGMAGENLDYGDQDFFKITDLK
ncbi:MAG: hypothetical protein QM237_11430 [Bacteroidota bacterium]|jgi:5-keto 4-deoxyuronate isomerase|nr:hypothetical protein [Bacteroidota bacterium]HHU97432.1 hypothetical protein [Petrimonas sp.]